jgi:dipeptide/tripeptide permease
MLIKGYYGFVPLLKNMFGKALGLSKYTYGLDGNLVGEADNTIPNVYRLNFDVVTYLTPLFGAFISDSYLDKYKTIMILSLLYMVGMYLLFLATNPGIFNFESVFAPIMEASPFNQTIIDQNIQYNAPSFVTSTPALPVYVALGLISFGTGGIKVLIT